MHAVFVYGSLMSGMGNNRVIAGGQLLGEARIYGTFKMLDLGHFPGLVEGNFGRANRVIGEVWLVDDETMRRLDRLEGYPRMYDRRSVVAALASGRLQRAQVYTYNAGVDEVEDGKLVPDCDWRPHYSAKFPSERLETC